MDGIIKKIAGIKGIGYVALAVAAAIIILCLPSSKSETKAEPGSSVDESLQYIHDLERRTEEIVSKISGVSECKVMISAESGFIYSFAADQNVQRSFDPSGAAVLQNEEKKYVTVSSDGTSSLVKTRETMPKISGIAVICPKATDSVRLTVTETIKALFDLSSNRISVQS